MASENRRFRVSALLAAAIAGFIIAMAELLAPADDAAYSMQAYASRGPASGQVVAIEIGEADRVRAGGWPWDYNRWAALIDRLLEQSPKRVFVDFVFTRVRPAAEEAAFEGALAMNGSRLLFPVQEGRTAASRPFIERRVPLVSIQFLLNPIGGDIGDLPYSIVENGKPYPTVAPALTGITARPGDTFVLDKSIDLESIPHFSYSQLASGQIPAKSLAGKYLVVFDAGSFQDLHQLTGYGSVHGGLVHALAVETLLKGPPVKIHPVYMFLLILSAALLLGRRQQAHSPWRAYSIGLLVAYAGFYGLLRFGIILPIVSAIATWSLFCWAEAWSRMRLRMRTEGGLTNLKSGMPNALALERLPPNPDLAVIAIQMPGLDARLHSSVDHALLASYAAALAKTGPGEAFDAGNGQLLLTHPVRDENLAGLPWEVRRIVLDHSAKNGHPEHPPHLGIDLDKAAPMADRVASALELSRLAKDEGILLRSATGQAAPATLETSTVLGHGPVISSPKTMYRLQICPSSGEAVAATAHSIEGPGSNKCVTSRTDRSVAFSCFSKVWTEALATRASLTAVRDSFFIMAPLPAPALTNAYLLETVRGSLRKAGVAPADMAVVVDVLDLMDLGTRGVSALAELRAYGLGVGLTRFDQHTHDWDFLRTLPSSILISDEQFSDLSIEENWALMRSTLHLSRQLGRELLATGVDDQESLRRLSSLGVDRCEGAVSGNYLSADDICSSLRSTSHRVSLFNVS